MACSTPCVIGSPIRTSNVRGPTNPSLNYELGLLIDGFDSSPMFMMTYNPPYYARLVENYGFRKAQDLSPSGATSDMLPKIGRKAEPVAEQIMERYKVRLRPLDKSQFPGGRGDVPVDLQPVAGQHVGLRADVGRRNRHMADGLNHLIVPELAIAAEVDGRMVGAVVRPARLQSAHSGDRRPAVSLRLHPPVAQGRRSRRSA